MIPGGSNKPGRLALSTSLQDFGFPHSSSAPSSPSVSVMTFDFDEPYLDAPVETPPKDTPPQLLKRMGQRAQLAVRTGSLGDLNNRVQSPLRTSFARRGAFQEQGLHDESDSEREREKEKGKYRLRHRGGSSPSSGSELPTPPLCMEADGASMKSQVITPPPFRQPSTSSIGSSFNIEGEPRHGRRLSHSVS